MQWTAESFSIISLISEHIFYHSWVVCTKLCTRNVFGVVHPSNSSRTPRIQKPLTRLWFTHTHTHRVDIELCQHAIWEQSCYPLSVLITAIAEHSADKSLCCFLWLLLLFTVFRGAVPSPDQSSVIDLFFIGLKAKSPWFVVLPYQYTYNCF